MKKKKGRYKKSKCGTICFSVPGCKWVSVIAGKNRLWHGIQDTIGYLPKTPYKKSGLEETKKLNAVREEKEKNRIGLINRRI